MANKKRKMEGLVRNSFNKNIIIFLLMAKSGLSDDIYVENWFKLEDNGSINSKYPESVPRSKARDASVIPFYPKNLLHGIMISLFFRSTFYSWEAPVTYRHSTTTKD
jgi:hypothetical protein